jgi:hypothetical protein
MKITRQFLDKKFPRQRPGLPRHNWARTGWIPITFFDEHEDEIRGFFGTGHRYYWRGPRFRKARGYAPHQKPECRRKDATHVVVY